MLSLPLILFGKNLIILWMGTAFDQATIFIFPIIICGFAMLGMNVTAHYVLLATGSVQIVTYLNVIAGVFMLLLMAVLIPRYGLRGAALSRLIYGPVTCLAYIYLYKIILKNKSNPLLAKSEIHELVSPNTR